MKKIPISPRPHWQELADQLGFKFHTLYGEPYWDETAYYQFTLEQIENDIEDPTAEIHAMCLELVDRIIDDEISLKRLKIPEIYWDYIRTSWNNRDVHLYGRIDLAYDGKNPAKLYEYNADTPTSIYESAFFQWVWLEQCVELNLLPSGCDQFNSLQERLIDVFKKIDIDEPLYFCCCKDTEEDRGTVRYLEDCAVQAGSKTKFIFIEDIGLSPEGHFTDLEDMTIPSLFKLYPWEWLFLEQYGSAIADSDTRFIEPPWKSLLSNKGMLPLLWDAFPNHPNLLPAYFEEDAACASLFVQQNYVKKPLFSREGANITVFRKNKSPLLIDGPYNDSGYIVQDYLPLPRFGDDYTLIGSWIIGDQPAGIGIREDKSIVTKDTSRFLPHIIL